MERSSRTKVEGNDERGRGKEEMWKRSHDAVCNCRCFISSWKGQGGNPREFAERLSSLFGSSSRDD